MIRPEFGKARYERENAALAPRMGPTGIPTGLTARTPCRAAKEVIEPGLEWHWDAHAEKLEAYRGIGDLRCWYAGSGTKVEATGKEAIEQVAY